MAKFSKENQPANAKRFTKDYHPSKGGNKPLVIRLCAETGIAPKDIKNAVLNILALNDEDLSALADNPDSPKVYKVLANALNDPDKAFDNVMRMLTFVYGAKLDITTNGGDISQKTINVVFSGEAKENING